MSSVIQSHQHHQVNSDTLNKLIEKKKQSFTKKHSSSNTSNNTSSTSTATTTTPTFKASDYVEITFKIISGAVFIPMDNNGLSDPFVKIGIPSLDGASASIKKWLVTSPTTHNTLKPEWNYTQSAIINIHKHRELVIELWDKDVLSADDIVGRNKIDLTEFKGAYYYRDLEIPIKSAKGELTGSIKLNIHAYTATDPLTGK